MSAAGKLMTLYVLLFSLLAVQSFIIAPFINTAASTNVNVTRGYNATPIVNGTSQNFSLDAACLDLGAFKFCNPFSGNFFEDPTGDLGAILLVTGIVAGAILVTGFLTSAGSRGGVTAAAVGVTLGGLLLGLITALNFTFSRVRVIGPVALGILAIAGFILVYQAVMEHASGRG